MRIIVAGAGEVGAYLAKMLSRENHDIVVIDPDEEKLKAISSHFDVLTVQGSSASPWSIFAVGFFMTYQPIMVFWKSLIGSFPRTLLLMPKVMLRLL